MSKPLAIPPDAEHIPVDILTAGLAARAEDVTVGAYIPATFAAGSKPHMQVALDGTPEVIYPILWKVTVRVTSWVAAQAGQTVASTTEAKRLAALCQAILCSYPGSVSVASVQPLTGVLPTRDPDTGAQLASVSVRVNLRMTVLA